MKTRAAVLWGTGEQWSIEDLDVAGPGVGEITVKIRVSGLCHSDDHNVTGDFPSPLPVVGGHEGAGEVVALGRNVTGFRIGDRVMLFPMPNCGRCRFCSQGRSWLCDLSSQLMSETAVGAGYRFQKDRSGIGAMTQLGTLSELTTISETQAFVVPGDISYESAALVGCGVSTGYGASVPCRQGGTR